MRIRPFLAAMACVTLSLSTAPPASAQISRNCGDRDLVVARLAETFGETRQSIGLGSNNQVMEVYASLETGTWSITITMPNGLTCLIAAGQAYEPLSEEAAVPDEDA